MTDPTQEELDYFHLHICDVPDELIEGLSPDEVDEVMAQINDWDDEPWEAVGFGD